MSKLIIFILISLFTIASHAGINKCQTESGIVYRDIPSYDPLPINTTWNTSFGDGGLRPGEVQMLRERQARHRSMDRPAMVGRGGGRETFSHAEQLRLRELRMRRNDLSTRQKNRFIGSGIAISEEIRSIDREVDLIYRSRQ